VIGGGAPIYARMTRALMQMMGEHGEVMSNYGATEALPSTELSGRESLRETWAGTAHGAGICVGRPFSEVEVRILRITDGPVASIDEATLYRPGEVGEIVVRGAHISPAYYGDEPNTLAHKIDAGDGTVWHRIGDAGYLDVEGRVWYCGRISQRVAGPEGPLFPLQVEPVFNEHPAVRRCGLIDAGGVPVVCVELEPSARSQRANLRAELLALAAAHPATRAIADVRILKRLPVDPRHNSKIDRARLARQARRPKRSRAESIARGVAPLRPSPVLPLAKDPTLAANGADNPALYQTGSAGASFGNPGT
jgi:acyl-CoA synthetase (AMP-forming)/AMP-acid ligase II